MKEQLNKLRLLVLIQGLQTGGLERVAVDLANGLQSRYEVTVCCYDALGPLKDRLSTSIEVLFLRRKPGIDFSYIFKLARLMRKRKIDALHAHNHTSFFYGTLAAKLSGIKKIVYTEHGRTEKLAWRTRMAHRLISSLVQRTVVVADYLKSVLVKEEGFPSEKISLIPNGIDPLPFQIPHDRSWLCRDFGIPTTCLLLGIVARLDPIKNHSMLLKAMKKVHEVEPRAKLLIVGDGPIRSRLEREVEELDLKKDVLFLGEVSNIPPLLTGLDLFVLSSLSEGMSITLVEAMAAGLPIVATQVGGNPSIITSEENGLLVPSNDPSAMAGAILRILRDGHLARSLAAGARQRFEEEFTLDKMVSRYREVIET